MKEALRNLLMAFALDVIRIEKTSLHPMDKTQEIVKVVNEYSDRITNAIDAVFSK